MNANKMIFTSALIVLIAHFLATDAMIAHYNSVDRILPDAFILYLKWTKWLPAAAITAVLFSGYWTGVRTACLAFSAVLAATGTGLFFGAAIVDIAALLLWAWVSHLILGRRAARRW